MKTRIFFILIALLLVQSTLYGATPFTVTFHAGNGTTFSQTINAGEKMQAPTPPAKDGEVFVGWFTDPDASIYMWNFPQDRVSEPLTLYAKYVQLDEKHRLLNAYASAAEQNNPYVAATLHTLGELSADGRTLTLPAGTTVYVAPGVYWTDQTYKQGFPFDDSDFVISPPNVGLIISGTDLSFIGLTADATDAQICGNRGEGGTKGLGANGSWYTAYLPTGFHARNITFANYAQEDLIYPRDPSQNMSRRITSTNHAEVLRAAEKDIDRIHFENVRVVGYLNLMAGFSPLRAYFKDCFFQATDDGLFYGTQNVYENCTFHLYGGHPTAFGAQAGGINALLGCKVVGMPQLTDTALSLTKRSQGDGASASSIYAIIDTKFLGRIESVEWENGVREDARHAVSNNTLGDGKAPLSISTSQPQTSVTYAGAALNAFKVDGEYNIYNLLRGADGWNPAGQDLTRWTPYANLPYRFLIGTTAHTLYSGESGDRNRTILTPAVLPTASVDMGKIRWEYDTEKLEGSVDPKTGYLTLVAKPNTTPALLKTMITGLLPNGISAGATLSIYPVPVAPPVLTSASIAIGKGRAELQYMLDQAGYQDVSRIEWYRETDKHTTDGIHVGTTRNDEVGLFVDEPYKAYMLGKYDVGYYLRAVITPKYAFSPVGDASFSVCTDRPVTATDVTETALCTDFKNLYVIKEDHLTTTGRWFFDCAEDVPEPWGWGIGTNGADKRWGLQNNFIRDQDARFVFAQPGRYGDMTFSLNFSTGKTEGQGFGGNGCFLDIYLKYDPATRQGYGLRVERVPASTNATEWTLYRYNGAECVPLAPAQLACAFMPQSTITVSVVGNTLRVVASTQSQRSPLQVEQNIPNTIDMAWTDSSDALRDNAAGGFGLRINNSSSSSYVYAASTNNCVMLHDVRVEAVEKVHAAR